MTQSTAISAQSTGIEVETGSGTAIIISSVAAGNPTILASASHGLANGAVVVLSGFPGAS